MASDIGVRNISNPAALNEASEYVERALRRTGLTVALQSYDAAGTPARNIVATLPSGNARSGILVLGAHYDSALESPGASDNATGIAALLCLAERIVSSRFDCEIRLVAFTNEEDPHFQTELMGSFVYARSCRASGDCVRGMVSLETIGYFSDEPGTQKWPFPVNLGLGNRANFLGVVSDVYSRKFAQKVSSSFQCCYTRPVQRLHLPRWLPGVGASDHWSFWQHGYPGCMLTDTANLRSSWFHTPYDTPDQVQFPELAQVTDALLRALPELTRKMLYI